MPADAKDFTVLCVDDEPTVLMTRKLVLQGAGYQVLTASGPREGLELFSSQPIHVVILDYLMPEMDGAIVARHMKRIRPNIPIIMISAYLNLPSAATEAVDAFVAKGEGPRALLSALGSLLNGRG